jgi:hypothetical protein
MPGRVYPGIRTSATDKLSLMTHHSPDGLLENTLYGAHTRLHLPTVKIGAVVRRQ